MRLFFIAKKLENFKAKLENSLGKIRKHKQRSFQNTYYSHEKYNLWLMLVLIFSILIQNVQFPIF